MAKAIRLRHIYHSQDLTFHFYDGESEVKKGVISIPVEFPYWARKAYIMGYRLDPKTGDELTMDQINEAFDRAAAKAPALVEAPEAPEPQAPEVPAEPETSEAVEPAEAPAVEAAEETPGA